MQQHTGISRVLFIGLVLMLGAVQVGWGQTTLSSGDIAIIGVNCDDPDDFAFLLLTDISSGTIIKFTDMGWLASGHFRPGEGIKTYTATTAVNAGTVISFGDGTDFTSSGSYALSASGDQLIAFQGDTTSPTLLYAVNIDGVATWQADATSSNTSALPGSLTNGSTAVAVAEKDNTKYNGSTSFSSPTNALLAISNSSNWIGDDATRYDLQTFGDFSLPVELTKFEAVSHNGKVVLTWTTESEIDNLGFLLERRAESTEPGEWTTVADYKSVAGLAGQGSTTQRTDYQYSDSAVLPGVTYSYRLGDVDYGGNLTWHQTVQVTIPAAEQATQATEFGLHRAYPNPFNPAVTLSYDITSDNQTTLQVFNVRGQLVATLVDEYQPANSYSLSWQPNTLSAGVYLVRLQNGGQVNVQKVVYVK